MEMTRRRVVEDASLARLDALSAIFASGFASLKCRRFAAELAAKCGPSFSGAGLA
jgi:hypothetical protein